MYRYNNNLSEQANAIAKKEQEESEKGEIIQENIDKVLLYNRTQGAVLFLLSFLCFYQKENKFIYYTLGLFFLLLAMRYTIRLDFSDGPTVNQPFGLARLDKSLNSNNP